MKKAALLIFTFAFLFFNFCKAQSVTSYPTNWWTGMKWNKVQVMIHAKDIGTKTISILPYAGVKLLKVNKVESPNYVFADLEITSTAKPGKVIFSETINETLNKNILEFELKP